MTKEELIKKIIKAECERVGTVQDIIRTMSKALKDALHYITGPEPDLEKIAEEMWVDIVAANKNKSYVELEEPVKDMVKKIWMDRVIKGLRKARGEYEN